MTTRSILIRMEEAKINGKPDILIDQDDMTEYQVEELRNLGLYVGYLSSHMSWVIRWSPEWIELNSKIHLQ